MIQFTKRKTARANNAFLLGSIVMIILVLVIVVLFLFFSFKIYEKQEQETFNGDRYKIVLGKTTLNSPLSVYINDSLIFNGTPQSTLTLTVGRFAQESSLLIVDGVTDKVTTIGLSEHSETVRIAKKGSAFFREEE